MRRHIPLDLESTGSLFAISHETYLYFFPNLASFARGCLRIFSPAKTLSSQRPPPPSRFFCAAPTLISPNLAPFAPLECQDKPGRSNILKGGYLVGCPFDK